jgi:Pathogenicity locus
MMSRSPRTCQDPRALRDLKGVGKATLADLHLLDVRDVATLARQDPALLYEGLCARTGVRQDPCVLDVFSCAVAQARDRDLPAAQREWWWWSRARKAARR